MSFEAKLLYKVIIIIMRYIRIYSKCSYMFKAQQRVRTIFTVIEMRQEMRYHGNTVRTALKKRVILSSCCII